MTDRPPVAERVWDYITTATAYNHTDHDNLHEAVVGAIDAAIEAGDLIDGTQHPRSIADFADEVERVATESLAKRRVFDRRLEDWQTIDGIDLVTHLVGPFTVNVCLHCGAMVPFDMAEIHEPCAKKP